MQREKDKLLEKLHEFFFSGNEEAIANFDKDQLPVVSRYRGIFSKWLAEPFLSDSMMVKFIQSTFGVCENQAYKDIGRVKIIIGNVENASKEFQRYRATEMILKGYEMASTATCQLEVKQAQVMIKSGEALGRIYMLDKNDMDKIPWEDIIPIELEPTTDISVIGKKPLKDIEAVKAKLRKRYGEPKAQDIAYEDVTDGKEEGVL